MDLTWRGGLDDVVVMLRARARAGPQAPRLVVRVDPATDREVESGVPAIVLAEQAARLGAKLEKRAATAIRPCAASTRELATARAAGVRGFIVAVRPPLGPELLGRFLDDHVPLEGRVVPLATLATEGPGFSRRLEIAALDQGPWGDGWRLDVGLRGC